MGWFGLDWVGFTLSTFVRLGYISWVRMYMAVWVVFGRVHLGSVGFGRVVMGWVRLIWLWVEM